MYVRMLFAYYYCVLRAIARGGNSHLEIPEPRDQISGAQNHWVNAGKLANLHKMAWKCGADVSPMDTQVKVQDRSKFSVPRQ